MTAELPSSDRQPILQSALFEIAGEVEKPAPVARTPEELHEVYRAIGATAKAQTDVRPPYEDRESKAQADLVAGSNTRTTRRRPHSPVRTPKKRAEDPWGKNNPRAYKPGVDPASPPDIEAMRQAKLETELRRQAGLDIED